VGDTEVLHEAVTVADQWRRMVNGDDDPLAPSRSLPSETNYDVLERKSAELFQQIKSKLPASYEIDDGAFVAYHKPKEASCDLRRREPPLDVSESSDWHKTIENNIKRILRNGIVISFVGNLVAFTQNFETAATFLESIDKTEEKKIALRKQSALSRYYFYSNRALSKYFANWYPPESIKRDFNEARSDMGAILEALQDQTTANKKMKSARRFFEAENARMLNNRTYYLLNESLQGRPLSQAEIHEVSSLAAELKAWIDRQPTIPDPEDQSNLEELVYNRQAHFVPAFLDTLATEQIVMVQLGRNQKKASCERIRTYLDRAQDLYTALAVKTSEEEHRSDFKIIAARRDMYDAICGLERPS
jgi:hypothetical protein